MTSRAPRPNIVVVLTDQQHHATITNPSPARTPNLNRLLQQGAVRFSNAFCPSPICTPSRASIQTGLLPHQHRLVHNTHRNYHVVADLAADTPTLGRLFTDSGYRTVYIGKWHVGRTRMPDQVGYEEFIEPAGPGRTEEALSDQVRLPGEGPRTLISAVTDRPPEETEPFIVLGAAADTIRSCTDDARPFFLFVSTQSPHVPCRTPRRYAEMFDPSTLSLPSSFEDDLADKPQSYRHFNWHNFCSLRDRPDDARRVLAHYYGQIALLDDAFGGVLQALEETGLRENTWVIFASDHGELAGAHGLIGKDELLCDELTRVPLVIAPPHGEAAAETPDESVREEFVSLTDLFATTLDLAGIPAPVPPSSRSLRPLIEGRSTGDFPNEIFAAHHGSQFFNTVRAIRTHRYKYVFRAHETDELYALVSENPAKRGLCRELCSELCRQSSRQSFRALEKPEFAHEARLDTDPGEMQNRITDPALATERKRLRARLVEHAHAVGDPAASGMRNHLLHDLPLVIVIGDSISIGYGPGLEAGLGPGIRYVRKQGLTAALADLDSPEGANSGDSGMVLSYLEALADTPDWHPDLLVFNCGLHDIKTDKESGVRQVPLEAYRDNLCRITRLLNERHVPAVWVRTTPVREVEHNAAKPFFRFESDVDAYNSAADAMMKEAGIPSLDLYAFTNELPAPFGVDGVHFMPEAQQAQAEFLSPRIKSIVLG